MRLIGRASRLDPPDHGLLDLTVGPAQSRDEVAKALLVRTDVRRAWLAADRVAVLVSALGKHGLATIVSIVVPSMTWV